MKRSLEDLDYEIESTEWTVKTMVDRLAELNAERRRALSKIFKDNVGDIYDLPVIVGVRPRGKPKALNCKCFYDKGKVNNSGCKLHKTK